MTEVTIIIPNYNGKKLLENCIKTLERQTCQEFKLLVIDNGSKDGSTDVTSESLDMEMVALPENTGFCGAVNLGFEMTTTPYAILLNNDPEAELCCRQVLIFTPESFSFIGKCFHASPLSVFIDRFISTSYNHDSYFY